MNLKDLITLPVIKQIVDIIVGYINAKKKARIKEEVKAIFEDAKRTGSVERIKQLFRK